MSIDTESLMQEFRQAVYEKHSSPQSARDPSPDGAIQRRAAAYRAWLESSRTDDESLAITPTLLRHWVAADITSLRSVDPASTEKAVAALHPTVFAYDTYAKLLKELDASIYEQVFSLNRPFSVVNGFSSGPNPSDNPSHLGEPSVVLSKLLEDIRHQERRDGSVLYLLRDKPIFVDHGQQILMEPGANDDEFAILVGLHMAKQKFGGSLELTGSEEFKRLAIEVMIKHDVQVELKNPAQESLRRELMGLPPIGETSVVPGPATTSNSQSKVPDPAPNAAPTEETSIGAAVAKVEPTPTEPVNHYKGEVLDYGSAPYQFDVANSRSFYVTLKNSDGEQRTTWGVDLERVIEEQSVGRGDIVELQNLGRKEVLIEVPIRDKEGAILRYEERQTHRNEWGADVTNKASLESIPGLPQPLEPGQSAIAAHDARWLVDIGVPKDTFDTHQKMLSMRGEDHALLLINEVETTPDGYATVERLLAQDTYRAAFAASIEAEFGRYNSHFQNQIRASEGYAIVQEMLADAERKYGPISIASLNEESLTQAVSSGDLDAVIQGIEEYDRQYLASLESHRQAVKSTVQDHLDPILPESAAPESMSGIAGPPLSASPEALVFTHNGLPAFIDLGHYSAQQNEPDVDQKATEQADASAPEPTVGFAEDLVPVSALEWWEGQRVAIGTWGRTLEEIETDLKLLGPEPETGQLIWFDKAGHHVPAPVDEGWWAQAQVPVSVDKTKGNGFVGGDNGLVRERDSPVNSQSATGVIELNSEGASMAQSESKPVLRGVTKLEDGSFDTTVMLFQGKGDYLQGFVKVNGEKHQVIAFMNERQVDPKTGEIKPNFITLSEPLNHGNDSAKWNQIGYGNAVNRRADGKPVHFDEVLLSVDGSIIKAKETRHVDDELHKKLGFVEPRKEREKPVTPHPGSPVSNVPPMSDTSAAASAPKTRVRA